MQYIFLVACPKCNNKQQTFSPTMLKGYCRCVYCGKLINRKKYNLGRVK